MNTRDMRFAPPKAPRHQMVLYPQRLDELVPADAPVRRLAALLEGVDWEPWERAYTGWGQPPIHPRYLAGAIFLGLFNKTHSTRELEEASCKHVDFMWLLEGHTPDHSTFANFRNLHAEAIEDLARHIAQTLVMKREEPLLQLVVDGTRLRADSDRQGARTATIIEAIIRELDRRMEEMKRNDAAIAPETGCFEGMEPPPNEVDKVAWVNREIAKLEKLREKYQKALDTARTRDARARQHNGKNAKPVRVPVTDPDAQIAPNKEGGYAPNYTPVAAVEPQTGAIVYADVLPGSDEANAVLPALQAAQALTGQKPEAVLADTNFAAGEVLAALDADRIDAYMPTRSASPPDNPAQRPDPSTPVAQEDIQRLPQYGKTFARTAFIYDARIDAYYCPMGHALSPYKHGKNKDGVQCTYYRCSACADCPLAKDCVDGKSGFRSITRDQYEEFREATNQRMATDEGRAIYKTRAPSIETVFGIIKSALGIRRFLRRGLDKVRTDWAWICTGYNLKKLIALGPQSAPKAPLPPGNGRFRPQNAPHERILRLLDGYVGDFLTNHRILRPWPPCGRTAKYAYAGG